MREAGATEGLKGYAVRVFVYFGPACMCVMCGIYASLLYPVQGAGLVAGFGVQYLLVLMI